MQRKARPHAVRIRSGRSVMLNVRVMPELKERLERMAERDHRTLSNLIELILERACGAAERKR
jgi:predicted DNA-binding protein